jgi:hypothetical protein
MNKALYTLVIIALGALYTTRLMGQTVVIEGGVIITTGGGTNCPPQPQQHPQHIPPPIILGSCGYAGYVSAETTYSEVDAYGNLFYSTYVDMEICDIQPMMAHFTPRIHQGMTQYSVFFQYQGLNYSIPISDAQYARYYQGYPLRIQFLK